MEEYARSIDNNIKAGSCILGFFFVLCVNQTHMEVNQSTK